MVAPSLNQHTWCLARSATLSFFSNSRHLHFFSVRFGDMAVHVEVPGGFWQGELHAFELFSENDLASQPGVLLKHGCHVQHVILPRVPRYVIYSALPFTTLHTFIEIQMSWLKKISVADLPLNRLWQFVKMVKTHIDLTC